MKLPKELLNGIIIFLGISVFFLSMNFLGLSEVFYLRLLNILFLFYGVNRTIVSNIMEGKKDFLSNAVSAFATSIIGVFMSVTALWVYSHMKGGDAFVRTLSQSFLFGNNPTVNTYCYCLLFEGIASCIIVTLILMFYHNNKYAID